MKRLLLYFLFCSAAAHASIKFKTVWGRSYKVKDPLLVELIQSPVMQRLKCIDQSGPVRYAGLTPPFSRYDHSVGVLALLMKANVSRQEQAAGLLHDASHTAFSHLGDKIFGGDQQAKAYQDEIHLEFLEKMGIGKIVEKYGMKLEQLDPDLPGYTALERPLPDLCADRLQYIIHSGVITGALTQKQARKMIDDVEYRDRAWYFKSTEYARLYADLTLRFTQEWYGAPWNCAFYEHFAQALRRALHVGLIDQDSLKYGVDQDILDVLHASDDESIKHSLRACDNIYSAFDETEYGQGDCNSRPKFRGVDPLVDCRGEKKRLSQIDQDFVTRYQRVQDFCQQGYGLELRAP
jgi:HD superfamily phosphohydrolase